MTLRRHTIRAVTSVQTLELAVDAHPLYVTGYGTAGDAFVVDEFHWAGDSLDNKETKPYTQSCIYHT